jgi:hypothetical protein
MSNKILTIKLKIDLTLKELKKLSRRRHGAKTYKKVLHDKILTKIDKTNVINS